MDRKVELLSMIQKLTHEINNAWEARSGMIEELRLMGKRKPQVRTEALRNKAKTVNAMRI